MATGRASADPGPVGGRHRFNKSVLCFANKPFLELTLPEAVGKQAAPLTELQSPSPTELFARIRRQ